MKNSCPHTFASAYLVSRPGSYVRKSLQLAATEASLSFCQHSVSPSSRGASACCLQSMADADLVKLRAEVDGASPLGGLARCLACIANRLPVRSGEDLAEVLAGRWGEAALGCPTTAGTTEGT